MTRLLKFTVNNKNEMVQTKCVVTDHIKEELKVNTKNSLMKEFKDMMNKIKRKIKKSL